MKQSNLCASRKAGKPNSYRLFKILLHAAIAQLVEQLISNHQVASSNLASSTSYTVTLCAVQLWSGDEQAVVETVVRRRRVL